MDGITQGPFRGLFIGLLRGLLSLIQEAGRGDGGGAAGIPKRRCSAGGWGAGQLGSWETAKPETQRGGTRKEGVGTGHSGPKGKLRSPEHSTTKEGPAHTPETTTCQTQPPLSLTPFSSCPNPKTTSIERRKPVTGDKMERHRAHMSQTHRGITSLGVHTHSHSASDTLPFTAPDVPAHTGPHPDTPPTRNGEVAASGVSFLTCPPSPASLHVPAYPTCWEKNCSLFSPSQPPKRMHMLLTLASPHLDTRHPAEHTLSPLRT